MKYIFIALSTLFLPAVTSGCKYLPVTNFSAAKIQPSFKYNTISEIPSPQNFQRTPLAAGTFGAYLRNLPLKQDNNTVYLYNGQPKGNQQVQFAVLKMTVGDKDLQQCADAVMRLRAEYLYNRKDYDRIHFNFVSDGKPRYFKDFSGGTSYSDLNAYLYNTFNYANTLSLKNELQRVDIKDMQVGDVFIKSGNPYGHAMIVVDMAENKATGRKMFMLAQSYMPAQEIHVVKNWEAPATSPWYALDFEGTLHTPEYAFSKDDLRRFPVN